MMDRSVSLMGTDRLPPLFLISLETILHHLRPEPGTGFWGDVRLLDFAKFHFQIAIGIQSAQQISVSVCPGDIGLLSRVWKLVAKGAGSTDDPSGQDGVALS